MASLDVTLFFSSIPRKIEVDSIHWTMENDSNISGRTSLTTDNIMNWIDLRLKTYLWFEGTAYGQMGGTVIESLLSELLADTTMKHFDTRAFEVN